MSDKRVNTSFMIGLAISAAAHIVAIGSLQYVRIDPVKTHMSLASLKPQMSLNRLKPAEEKPKPPEDPNQPKPPEPPKEVDRNIRFGIDDAKIESDTWLGFLEGDSSSDRQGETNQAAMALDPGAPGAAAPGSAGSPGNPGAPPTPPAGALAPSANAPADPSLPAPPAELDKPPDAKPQDAKEAAPSPSRAAPPQASPAAGQTGEKTENPDPLAPRSGVENAKQPEKSDATKAVEHPKPDGTEQDKPEKPDAKNGEEREGEVRETQSEKMSSEDGKGEADKELREVKAKVADATEKPDPTQPPLPPAPPAEAQPQPATPSQPSSQPSPAKPPTPATGGQSKQAGVRSDRESEAFSKKVIETPMRDGRVQAGRGLNIITRRADFTNTTLLTAPPRDTMVRISFQKSGSVRKAEFVNGSATGNPNVDDPLMNAIYRWRASGKDLASLNGDETLSVVVRVTFK